MKRSREGVRGLDGGSYNGAGVRVRVDVDPGPQILHGLGPRRVPFRCNVLPMRRLRLRLVAVTGSSAGSDQRHTRVARLAWVSRPRARALSVSAPVDVLQAPAQHWQVPVPRRRQATGHPAHASASGPTSTSGNSELPGPLALGHWTFEFSPAANSKTRIRRPRIEVRWVHAYAACISPLAAVDAVWASRMSASMSTSTQLPRERTRASYHPSLGTVLSSPLERPPSPEKSSPATTSPLSTRDDAGKLGKISGPINGAPIPAGYKFGSKDPPPEHSSNERERKSRSRAFWRWPTGAYSTVGPCIVY